MCHSISHSTGVAAVNVPVQVFLTKRYSLSLSRMRVAVPIPAVALLLCFILLLVVDLS